MAEKKANQSDFESFSSEVKQTLTSLNAKTDKTQNLVKGCTNYVEKYLPLYTQRQVSDFIEYVFNDRAVKWRVNWYNEIKIPLLTTGILYDNGEQSLMSRVDLLHEMVTKTVMPPLPGDVKSLTPEEEFTFMALRNKHIHARAKIIMMSMLEQVRNPDK